MSIRYKLWNKTDIIKTRVGERLTPAEWMLRHPEAETDYPIVSGGSINGDLSDCLEDMLIRAKQAGFTPTIMLTPETAQAVLDELEAWENGKLSEVANYVSAEERIAAALEFQNIMSY